MVLMARIESQGHTARFAEESQCRSEWSGGEGQRNTSAHVRAGFARAHEAVLATMISPLCVLQAKQRSANPRNTTT
jgi:hypothetical protein